MYWNCHQNLTFLVLRSDTSVELFNKIETISQIMNSVMWFEVPYDDSDRAQKFYKDTFGWQINKIPDMEYFMAMTTESDPQTMQPKNPGAINGGMFKKDSSTSQ